MSEQTALFQTPAPPTLEALINSLDSHHYLLGDAEHTLKVPGQKSVQVCHGWLIVEPSNHDGYFFATCFSSDDILDGLKKPLLKSALAKYIERVFKLPQGMTFEICETDEPATYNRWLFSNAEQSFQEVTLGRTQRDLDVLREAKERAERKAARAANRAAKAKGVA